MKMPGLESCFKGQVGMRFEVQHLTEANTAAPQEFIAWMESLLLSKLSFKHMLLSRNFGYMPEKIVISVLE